GLDDLARENLRPRLIPDLEPVTESLGDEQQRAVAFALQQCIRCNGGAHFDRTDFPRWDGLAHLEVKEIANALHRGVGISLRIFRQKLVRDQLSVRASPDDVGESAATIDPEIPTPHDGPKSSVATRPRYKGVRPATIAGRAMLLPQCAAGMVGGVASQFQGRDGYGQRFVKLTLNVQRMTPHRRK